VTTWRAREAHANTIDCKQPDDVRINAYDISSIQVLQIIPIDGPREICQPADRDPETTDRRTDPLLNRGNKLTAQAQSTHSIGAERSSYCPAPSPSTSNPPFLRNRKLLVLKRVNSRRHAGPLGALTSKRYRL
jgi:hypothetical protein